MKTSHLLAIATALAGFGLGWALKPSGEGSADATAAADSDGNPPARVRAGDSDLVAPEAREAADRIRKATEAGATSEVVHQKILAEMGKSFEDVQSRRDRARLLRLVEALGLDDEQSRAVAALLAKFSKNSNPYSGGDLGDHETLLARAASASGEFEKSLRALLDDDQLERLDAYRTRESENRVESRAQQQLAKMSASLDLSEDQRSAILERYRSQARTSLANQDPGWSVLDGQLGMVGGDSSRGEIYREAFNDPAFRENPEAFRERIREAEQELVNDQVDQVVDLLTPAQAEEYRAQLEAATSVIDAIARPSARDPRFRRDP